MGAHQACTPQEEGAQPEPVRRRPLSHDAGLWGLLTICLEEVPLIMQSRFLPALWQLMGRRPGDKTEAPGTGLQKSQEYSFNLQLPDSPQYPCPHTDLSQPPGSRSPSRSIKRPPVLSTQPWASLMHLLIQKGPCILLKADPERHSSFWAWSHFFQAPLKLKAFT